jgi:sulfur carrier protein ThiS
MTTLEEYNQEALTDAAPAAQPVVKIRVNYSIFDDLDFKEDELLWFAEKTLADYLEGLPSEENWVVSLNGEIMPKERWPFVVPSPDDYLVLKLVPTGGGKNKSIFRIVAMIGVAIAGSILTFGAGLPILGAAVSIVGGVLVSALFPPPKPKKPDTDEEDSPSYGLDGPKNTSSEDVPVPVVLGEYRVGGNLVNIRLENDGNTQIFYGQYVVSEGEIESIDDFEVNDQPAANFNEVEFQTRMGTDNQSIVGWFNDTVVGINKSIALTHTDWIGHTTTQPVDKLGLTFVCPNGLVEFDEDDGDRETQSTVILAEYRKQGDIDWLPFGEDAWTVFTGNSPQTTAIRASVTVTSPAGVQKSNFNYTIEYRPAGSASDWEVLQQRSGTIYNDTRITGGGGKGDKPAFVRYLETSRTFSGAKAGLPLDEYEIRLVGSGSLVKKEAWSTKPIIIRGNTVNALRFDVESAPLEQGIYEIQVKRFDPESTDGLTINRTLLDDVNEIIADDIRYNFTAFYGIKIRFTDQLSRLPKVTARVRGVKCRKFDIYGNQVGDREWTQNPAWQTIEALTNTRWGGSMPLSRLHMPSFVEWAEHCDLHNLQFNGIFDTTGNIWDALQQILRMGHAQIVPVGTKYSIVIEREEEPVMMFSVANIIKDTFEETWLSLEDRANEIEVVYYDKTEGNKRKTVRVPDLEVQARGVPPRIVTIDLKGCDNAETAWREGWIQLFLNKYVLKSIKFDAPLQAIGCSVGSVVYVQHDIPEWGNGGFTKAGSTTTVINLDRPVEMLAAHNYVFMVHHSAISHYTAQVVDKIGDSIYCDLGAGPLKRVTRLTKADGTDVEVHELNLGSPNTEIVLLDASAINIGQTIELWETDVMETRDVVLDIGEHTTITLTSPLTLAPAALSGWMFGEPTKVKKKFRVRDIEGDEGNIRTLSLTEYNALVYSDPTDEIPEPDRANQILTVFPPLAVFAKEYQVKHKDGTIANKIQIDWQIEPGTSYEGAQVWISRNGSDYEMAGTVGSRGTTFTTEEIDGAELQIKVLPFDGARILTLAEIDPVAYTVIGKLAPPADVTNFAAQAYLGPIEFTWTHVPDLDLLGYEIRKGVAWEDEAAEIIIEEFTGNRFNYIQDTGGTFQFWIKAKDTSGNYSANPVGVTVQVPGPKAVRGFQANTNNNLIIFTWLPNTDQKISGYELREGTSWENGTSLGQVSGTSHAVPVNNNNNRTFWIKAINTIGIRSENATFASPIIAELPEYNIVQNFDKAPTFAGKKINFSVNAGTLEMAVDATHAEYVFDVDLLETFLARNQLSINFDVLTSETMTWDEATFTWASNEANRAWLIRGDADTMSMTAYIALQQTSLQSHEIEVFSLDNTLVGLGGSTATVSTSVTFDNTLGHSRYGEYAMVLDEDTELEWDKPLTPQFTVTFWVVLEQLAFEWVVFRLTDINDNFLSLTVDDSELKLTGSDDVVLTLGTADGLAFGTKLMIGISQTDTERRLFLGNYETLVHAAVAAPAVPIIDV